MEFFRQVRCAVALGVVLSLGMRGDDIGEYQIKAAFLCNFAKFVEWPPQTFKTPNDPIVICVLGRNPFGNALEAAASRSAADGRTFAIREISEVQPGCNCQILFVGAPERKRFRSVAGSIEGNGILTVGESQGFTSDGGIINFKLVDGRVRFDINTNAAGRENLRISSRLLTLADNKK